MKSHPDLPLEAISIQHLFLNHLLDIVRLVTQFLQDAFCPLLVALEQCTEVIELLYFQWRSDARKHQEMENRLWKRVVDGQTRLGGVEENGGR